MMMTHAVSVTTILLIPRENVIKDSDNKEEENTVNQTLMEATKQLIANMKQRFLKRIIQGICNNDDDDNASIELDSTGRNTNSNSKTNKYNGKKSRQQRSTYR